MSYILMTFFLKILNLNYSGFFIFETFPSPFPSKTVQDAHWLFWMVLNWTTMGSFGYWICVSFQNFFREEINFFSLNTSGLALKSTVIRSLEINLGMRKYLNAKWSSGIRFFFRTSQRLRRVCKIELIGHKSEQLSSIGK